MVEAATPATPQAPQPPQEEENPFGKPPENLPPLEPGAPTRITDTAGVRLEKIDLANGKQRWAFIDVAPPLYKGDPNYIEPLRFNINNFLNAAKSPAFKNLEVHALIAYKGDKPVGRITAHIDKAYDRYHGVRAGWFGFFECINDRKVAHALLAEATRWLKEKGAEDCIGPMNFTTNHQCGLLVDNFDRPPMVEMTYNPRYYEELLTSFGFAKAKDLLVWWIDVSDPLSNKKVARIARIADKVKERDGVTIRHADKKKFDEEVALIFKIYNEAWQKNWGYVPVEREEFEQTARDLKAVIREELVLFVEVKGKPVAFGFTLPDLMEIMPKNGRLFPFAWWKLLTGVKKIRHGRLMALGVIPEGRMRGLESMLFIETALRCSAIGIKSGEIGWTLEDNHRINRAVESMDGKLNRRYRLLGVKL